MDSFFPFFITLFAGLLMSSFFNKFHFPWVITLIISGILIGPHGFNIIEVNDTILFIAETGLVLLMFMAGLETRLSSFKGSSKKIFVLSFINGYIPFIVGFLIGYLFGYDMVVSILLGIIFVSSSIAVVVPTLESSGLIKTPLGKNVLATSILQDVASLILLSLFLQAENTLANLPLIIFYPIVIITLFLIRAVLPKLQKLILKRASGETDFFHRDIRAVLLVLFGIVLVFDILGLHPIIAGFFAGLVLSETLESEILLGKIRAISYGIFIPTFFILVGTQTNIDLLLSSTSSLLLAATVILGSAASKFISGSLGAHIVGFNRDQSFFLGASSIPQLSTTLAATFTARNLNLIGEDIVTSMVALSVVSTVLGPVMMKSFNKYLLTTKDVKKGVKSLK